MQLEHSFTLPVGIDEAWRTLIDIGAIAPSMPGSTVEQASPDQAEGSLKVKLGPLNLTYKGTARLVESDPDARRAVVEASGASRNGSAIARVVATLSEDGAATTVSLVTDLDVTGKPAQFGPGVLSEVGSKLVSQFAAALSENATATPVEPAPAEPVAAEAPVRAKPRPRPRKHTDTDADVTPPVETVPAAEAGTAAAEVVEPSALDETEIDGPIAEAGVDELVEQDPLADRDDLTADVTDDVSDPVSEAAAHEFVTPPADSLNGARIASVNGHGSAITPTSPTTNAGGGFADLARPVLVRGVAPAALAALFVLGALRRRRQRG